MPIDTPRLRLREFTLEDAPFIVELLNDEAFLKNIGDRGVRNLDDAVRYLNDGPFASYRQRGYGLWAAQRKDTNEIIGMCGLLCRDTLPDPDIGYAFLPRHRSQGYAVEACTAVLDHAARTARLPRVLAITLPANLGSVNVLKRIGLRYEREIVVANPTGDETLHVYSITLPVATETAR